MTPEQLDHIIREHYPHADHIMTDIIHASHTTGLPLSYGVALIEGESAFRNIYGHDPVPNPAPKGGRVTQANYRTVYLPARRRGLGMQGVGYTQLTWYAFQDEADRLGGCWRPYPNIVVGFRTLINNIHAHGKRGGAARFNGTGPAADAYGRNFVERQEVWHERLT